MKRLTAGTSLINVTSQENPLWRFKESVKSVMRIFDLGEIDQALIVTEVNRARFTVIGKAVHPVTEEQVILCELYSNALDGDRFILGQSFMWDWDNLVEPA